MFTQTTNLTIKDNEREEVKENKKYTVKIIKEPPSGKKKKKSVGKIVNYI